MRNKLSNILWGAFFIGLAVLITGNIYDWWNVTLFFPGWWTLFIIIPCAIAAVKNGFNTGNVVGLGVGFILLLSQQSFFHFVFDWKLIFPIILVVIGLSLILGRSNHNHHCCSNDSSDEYIETNFTQDGQTQQNNTTYTTDDGSKKNSIPEIVAIFCGQKRSFDNTIFKGANLSAMFGGFEIDLRTAIIPENCVINSCTIFGGGDIVFPPNVNVVVHSTPIFGGVSNKTMTSAYAHAPTVEVNATCIFGGLDLK